MSASSSKDMIVSPVVAPTSNPQTYSLWILIEGNAQPYRYNLTFDLNRQANLSDLSFYLVREIADLAGDRNYRLEFLQQGQSLSTRESLKNIETSENSLVVRYPLSSNTIVANVRFLSATREIRIPHTTGTWHIFLAQAQADYERLQGDGGEFYFVDQETKKTTIDKEFTFNDIVKRTQPNNGGEIIINLLVRIKGKKAYGDWTTKNMLREILLDQYETIRDIPKLDIDNTFGTECVLDYGEIKHFTTNLAEITSAFNQEVDTNEATARNFINPFMVKAVSKVKSKYPLTRLAVKEDFDGSRGYGCLNYVVYCQKPAILITEAKMTEMQKGITQNIVQLHTAAEKKRKREPPARTGPSIIYGIVSTGKQWKFLRWFDPPNAQSSPKVPKAPSIEVSVTYDVAFEGDMHKAIDMVSIIIRILQSCAKAEAENKQADEHEEADEEGRSSKHRG